MKAWFEVYLTEILGSTTLCVKLPLSKEDLSERIKQKFGEKEYIIEITDNHGLYVNEFTNIFRLNEFALFLKDYDVDEKTLECIAQAGQNSLEDVESIIVESSFSIIDSGDNFSDEEKDLGLALYSNNLLDVDLPKELVSKGYIDFTAIGRDAQISFGWVYVAEHKSYCRTW